MLWLHETKLGTVGEDLKQLIVLLDFDILKTCAYTDGYSYVKGAVKLFRSYIKLLIEQADSEVLGQILLVQ